MDTNYKPVFFAAMTVILLFVFTAFADDKQPSEDTRLQSQKQRQHSRDMFRRKGKTGPEGGRAEQMRSRYREYIDWLEKNYPEKAENLARLREKTPGLYMRKLALSMKCYGRIAEAAKENPELAEILKKDMELKTERDELLEKLQAATDKEQKDALIEELSAVIGQRYDLIVKRKEMEYEQLLRRLDCLKQQVQQSKADLESQRATEFKQLDVKARLEELLSRKKGFKWD